MSKLSSAIPSEQNLAANFANQHESDKEIDSRAFAFIRGQRFCR
jgi:hypothetical protein